jgi:hypothetical protein
MDFFQGVVSEYLRADRSIFINTECLLALKEGDLQTKGAHWYCDIMAISVREQAVYLCEVSYAANLQKLIERLAAWNRNWTNVCIAICRDSGIPEGWAVQPWVFLPEERIELFKKKLPSIWNMDGGVQGMPKPIVTYLESVVPWKYQTWDRKVAALEECD